MPDLLAATVQRVGEVAGGDPARAVAAVVETLAIERGVDVDLRIDGRAVPADPGVRELEIPAAVIHDAGHLLPGLVRETLTSATGRRRSGVHHTRHDVAATVLDVALGAGPEPRTIGDPSVGGGAFLLAAAERLAGPPHEVVGRLVGCDVDPVAVATTESALALWSGGRRPPRGAIRVADFLEPAPFGGVRPDLVVGNPPFLGQLRRSTTRDDARRAQLRARWPDVGAYLDEAAAFMLAATELTATGGVVALVQPLSFLSTRDARAVRARLAEVAPPVAIWIAGGRVFHAAVDTCAIVCRSGAVDSSVRRLVGVPSVEHPPAVRPEAGSWAPLIADLAGTPAVDVSGPALSTLATVTAGFRDQFYGIRSAVIDDPGGRHPLITSGLIDPLELQWGRRSCRYDGRRWSAPTVVLDRVDESVRRWVQDRLRPKLVLASQTRVIEAAADPDGRVVPCTPVVVVEPHSATDLWHLAAVLTSPIASAEIALDMAGSALSPDALRISAGRVGSVTLPPPGSAWDRAAESACAAATADGTVVDVGRATLDAFGVDDDPLLEWWTERLPRPRRFDEAT